MIQVAIKRVYDPESEDDGLRVLIDRLWPRGMRRDALHYDLWDKQIAPSNFLRTWFHEDPAGRWEAFEQRYTQELSESEAMRGFLERIRRTHHITLLYASKNASENHAVILRQYILDNL